MKYAESLSVTRIIILRVEILKIKLDKSLFTAKWSSKFIDIAHVTII